MISPFAMKYLAIVSTLVLAACGPKSTFSSSSREAAFQVGNLDSMGRLIFWSIDAYDRIEPVSLRSDDFGVVLYNDGLEDAPVARYILAFQKTREIVHTDDFAAFKLALSRVPRGSTIGRYDTCSVPRSYGLPESVVTDFQQALTDAGLRVETEARLVCYCPVRG